MSLLSQYLGQTEFSSYADFYQNFRLRVPDHFNFAYDVLDVYSEQEPERTALVWSDDRHLEDQRITFGELQKRTNRFANLFRKYGIGKGDPVMLVMKSRHEFWPALLALHKLSAIAIPATHMLKKHDLVYRIENGQVKGIVAVPSEDLLEQIDLAENETGVALKCKMVVGGKRPGWQNYADEVVGQSAEFVSPPRAERNANSDIMLIYFTSGTASFPKMVSHNFVYPLAHILTARYWQNVEEGGLHYTVADTGWAKAVWEKFTGSGFPVPVFLFMTMINLKQDTCCRRSSATR